MTATTTDRLGCDLVVVSRVRCEACGDDVEITSCFSDSATAEEVESITAADRRNACDLARVCTHRQGQLGAHDA